MGSAVHAALTRRATVGQVGRAPIGLDAVVDDRRADVAGPGRSARGRRAHDYGGCSPGSAERKLGVEPEVGSGLGEPPAASTGSTPSLTAVQFGAPRAGTMRSLESCRETVAWNSKA